MKLMRKSLCLLMTLMLLTPSMPVYAIDSATEGGTIPPAEASALDGEAGPVVEADSNTGSDTTVNTDIGADADANTTDGSDQVTEGDKEDPLAIEEGGAKKAEPKKEGAKAEANTEAKDAANGTEDEDGDEPVASSGEKGPDNGQNTSANIMDFIPPGTITMIHESDNSPVTPSNPARPGEKVYLSLTNVAETINGLQFDMNEMSMDIPAGLVVPEESETDTSNVQVTDYSVHPQQTYGMQNTYVIGSDGKIRYIWNQLATEERPPGSGNIVDVYQLACNAENFKYSLNFEMTVGDDADSIDFGHGITFPVDRSVALTVTKSIEIPGMSTISQTQAQAMTFALFNADGSPVMRDGQPVTFTRNDMTPSGLANGEWSISGLTADEYPATFIVRETGHPEIEGYTFLTAGDNVVTEKSVEIPAGQSKTAALKNRYTKDVSQLKVKKLFPSGALNYGNLTDTQRALISFQVKNANGDVVASATLAETNKFDANGEWNVGTLPPGEYTVVETSELEGYTRYATYKVDTNPAVVGPSSGPVTAPVTLVTDQEHVVEFNNTYTEQRDDLKIKKTFAGAALTDAEKANITFTITCPDGTTIVKHYSDFDENGELVLNDVLTGTYKVVETNVNPNTTYYTVTSTYSVNGGTAQSGTSANSVPVTLDGTNEVDFTNEYTAIGKITVKKEIGGDYWALNAAYSTKKSKIGAGVTFNIYKLDDQGNRITPAFQTVKLTSFNNSSHAYTFSNIPAGNYEIEEVVTGVGNISYTTRTTTVKVGSGTEQSSETADFSVPKGGTTTVTYTNNYTKNKGKIKLDKEVWIDGVKVTDWSTLTEDQQKAMKFKVTGKDVFGNSISKEVSLYDILNHQNGVDANGYIEFAYSNSAGYTVTESGADLPNYIRVTTSKKDNGEFGPGASVTSLVIDDTTTEHTATFKNEYTGTGMLKVDKTVSGLSIADEATVRGQIYFTIADTSGRPIVKENGKYVLGEAGATPAQIPLSELTAENGIALPTGTYILTEHNGEFNTEIYTWSVTNVIIDDGQQVDPRTGATSGNATVTLGNTKHVQYTNTYTRKGIGPGGGVSVIKHVLLDGVEIDASYSGVYGQIYNTVIENIRFKIYEGTEINDANLIEGCPVWGYSYAQLRANPPIVNVGTYTIQETNYNVDHYKHAIYFTVNGVTTREDHVTITVTQNQHVNVEVYNGYIPLGDLEVLKVIDDTGDLKAADLTDAQKQAIKFSVIGYKDTSYSEIIWPEQDPDATEPQPYEFTYADMTPNADGVMSKAFNDIPIGVYVVLETSGNHDGDIPNYNAYLVEDPAGDALEVHWNTSGDQTAVKKFTNKYTRQKGNLEVTKTFDAPSTLTTEQKRAIRFTVDGPDPSMPQTFTYAQMSGGKKTFEDVITGTYTITETNADFDYFERTTTVSVNGGNDTLYNETSGVTASVENDATASVHFTNEYQERGALIVNKTFDDSECINKLTDAQKKAIIFRVYDSNNYLVTTITYAQILSWIQQHPSQDPAGYRFLVLPGDYTIVESNADFPGYTRTTTATVDGQAATVSDDTVSATVVEFDQQAVEFNNKYNEIGKLKVKKIVEDLELNEAQKAAITFTVTRVDTVTKDETVIATFTYADILAATNQEYVIEDLPAGDYVVTETVNDEESVFYGKTRRTSVKVGAGDWTQNSTTTVQVDSKDNVVTFRNKYGNTDQLTVQKEIGGAPTAYIVKDGTQYPVWKFNLKIANLEPSTTSNGSTDIIDYIDNKALLGIFKVVTDPADLALIDAEDSGAATIANILTTTESKPTANVTLEEDYDQGKVTFQITGITAETATSNDLTYYLIPKDATALETLNARAGSIEGAPTNQCKKYFANVAEYKRLPLYDYETTNQVDYEYEKLVVKKRITNYNTTTHQLTDDYGNIVNVAEYEFVINPEEMKLSNDGYIDVTDTFSTNQSVDQESITVERCVYDFTNQTCTNITPAQEGDVTYKDLSGHKILLTLKDETCFRVTYTATLLYTAEELQTGDPLNLNNMVEVEGYKDGIEPTILPSSEGGGSVYRIRLRKYEAGNLDNPLKGAKFRMYLNEDAANRARETEDYSQALPEEYTTDKDGVITINQYTYNGSTHHVTSSVDYYFVESEAPEGYEKIDYTVKITLAAEGETADYTHYIYLPSDTAGIKDYPFETNVALGALKTFNTHESGRQLTEGEFTFKIKAVDNAPMPTGTIGDEITVPNGADGKALFGTIPYDTEDVITRDGEGNVTDTTKTFHYQVSEVLPDGVTEQNPTKDGVHYDTHTYDVAVTVAIASGALTVTRVTVDDTAIQPDNNVYFVGATNEYTAQGTWTPNIQKDLEGRTLEEGEFTFQIIDKDDNNKVLATGSNNADGTVTMDPESLTFTLADLGTNNLQVKEVYTVQTDDGIYSVADDVDVTVTVREKEVKDGTLNVTANPEGSLNAPIVMTNKFKASGSWHPTAEKEMDGVLKINAGDYSFVLTAVGNAPMPEGVTGSTLTLPCDADGKVDFGQIDFRQGIFDNVKYEDGDKEFHYTIQEEIPDPEDRIFGVEYDDTVYEITVKTTINKTNKLGVAVICTPATGWNVDENTATFTGTFTNEYGPTPAEATPEYEKHLTGNVPSEDLTFEFKLEQAADPNGDFYYVKVKDENGDLQPFATQTKELTLGPTTSLSDFGLFDEITFLAEGTYKFKITETPYTNGDLDPYIYYDRKVYTYTVVVTGEGTELQATGTYSYVGEDQAEQTAEKAVFTNKYTPVPTAFTPMVHKTLNGEPTVEEKKFQFTMTPDADNPDGGAFHGEDAFAGGASETIEIVIPAGENDAEKAFETIGFEVAGTYVFHIEEKDTTQPGVNNDPLSLWDLTIEVEDQGGKLKVISSDAVQVGGDLSSEDGTVTFTNVYTPNPVQFAPPVKKVMEGEPLVKDKTFTFTIEADSTNPEDGAEIANDTTSITVPAGETNKEGAFEAITFKKAGTYKFAIKEKKGDISQIGYSEDVSYLTVVIEDTDPNLVVTSFKFEDAATADGTSAEFTNTYTPTPVEYMIPVKKILAGPVPENYAMTFDFTLSGPKSDAVTMPDKATISIKVTSDGSGNVTNSGSFDKILFTKAGEYEFTVTEVKPREVNSGFTYDTTPKAVTITVTDNDGKLEITDVTGLTGPEGSEAVEVTNTYTPPPKVPKTGDSSLVYIWIALLALSAMSLCGTILVGRKRRHVRKR